MYSIRISGLTIRIVEDDAGDPLGRPAVPEVRDPALFPLYREDAGRVLLDVAHVDELVRSFGDRDGPFRVRTQGQAGQPQVRRLFLDAAGVGQDESRVVLQRDELPIAHRLDDPKLVAERRVDREPPR